MGDAGGGRRREEGRSAEDRSSVAEAEAVGQHRKADGSALLPSSLFRFPLGRHAVTSLWAHTWGKVRPQLRNASNEIVVVGAPMFARHDLSYLWTAATTNGSVVLTWENFFLGNPYERSAANLHESTRIPIRENPCQSVAHPSITAQLELFPNGDFIARSNDVERVYRRVNPDDWDDDGIPNGEDTEPFAPADVPQFGPHQTLPEGADTNHYYWIDLVVPHANARVAFEGDGDSDLPDPDFIARADETNRVALLIGKAYCVRSTLPFAVVGRESPEVEVLREGGGLTVRWPVTIDYVDVASVRPSGATRQTRVAGSGGTTMRIRPPRAKGGTYGWPGRFCCYTLEADGTPVFSCDGACGCGGCSTGDVVYRFAGYEFTLGGWSCGCSHVSPDEPLRPGGGEGFVPGPSSSVPGATVWFTEGIVLFEDAYASSPAERAPLRSTETRLVCRACGGPKGGRARIWISGDGSLVQCGGRPLPFERELAPFEEVAFTNVYRAILPSARADEIVAAAAFEENVTGLSLASESRATAVRVEVSVFSCAPENECEHRHKFGIGEKIQCSYSPQGAFLEWKSSGDGSFELSGASARYLAPLHAEKNGFYITGEGCSYTSHTQVVEPEGVLATDANYQVADGMCAGQAGGIILVTRLHVQPLDVFFSGIRVEEIPDAGGTHTGYFEDIWFMSDWYHGTKQGAGVWENVVGANEFLMDHAGFTETMPQLDGNGHVSENGTCGWTAGVLTWNVPCGWGPLNAEAGDDPVGTFADDALQVMSIDVLGDVEVRKHGNAVRREVGGDIILNGRLIR